MKKQPSISRVAVSYRAAWKPAYMSMGTRVICAYVVWYTTQNNAFKTYLIATLKVFSCIRDGIFIRVMFKVSRSKVFWPEYFRAVFLSFPDKHLIMFRIIMLLRFGSFAVNSSSLEVKTANIRASFGNCIVIYQVILRELTRRTWCMHLSAIPLLEIL